MRKLLLQLVAGPSTKCLDYKHIMHFKVLEHLIKQGKAVTIDIPPKPLDSLIVGTSSYNNKRTLKKKSPVGIKPITKPRLGISGQIILFGQCPRNIK